MRHSNFSYVIDSSFTPFTMQEMLVPFTAYKDAFEQSEAAYDDLRKRSDDFKYLSETLPEGSRARQIYEGYANDLNAQAEDFARNGLNMENRSALTNLRQRYQGEIGRLNKADEAYRKELELRRALSTKDSSMLYASDNLGIDDFLDNATPNLYNISGNELYSRGAAAGKAVSSRIYNSGDGGSTLGGYYRRWVETNGISPESMAAFRANASSIPELQKAADAILAERGVTDNLTGSNLERARQSVINGIIDGAVYQESVKPVRDENVLGVSDRIQLAQQGYEWKNGELIYNADKDPAVKRAKAIAEVKNNQGTGTGTGSNRGSGGSSSHHSQLDKRMKIEWVGDDPESSEEDAVNIRPTFVEDDTEELSGRLYNYDDLPEYAKKQVDEVIGYDGADADYYQYYFQPFERGTFDDTEAVLEIVPRKIVTGNSSTGNDSGLFSIN